MTLQKPPLLASLCTFIAFVILCSLGNWQVQRLAWKENILTKLNTAYSTADTKNLADLELADETFAYGFIEGELLYSDSILLTPRTNDKGRIGAHWIIPLKQGKQTFFANLGWTDQTLDALLTQQNPIHVKLEGLARKPEWIKNFTPENVPDKNQWYRADLQEIAAIKNLNNPVGFLMDVFKSDKNFVGNFPNNQKWQPNNNHGNYAGFWFLLAGTLVVMFIIRFVIKRDV